MQIKRWPGVGPNSDYDPYGNVLLSWVERGEKQFMKILLSPFDKPMDQVRAELVGIPEKVNILVPQGWLYVCTHCGSRRMDRHGLAAYSDEDKHDPFVWGPECISAAVLVSEEEYNQGRKAYDEQRRTG